MRENNTYNLMSFISMFSFMRISLLLSVCFLTLTSFQVNEAEPEPIIEIKLNPIVSFDDVAVEFVVNNHLKFETDVIIVESNNIYINIEDLFRDLGLKCISENNGNNLTGFIENESKKYNIDFHSSQITVGSKTYKSVNGIIKESGAIYIESTVLTEAFGLNVMFNFRSLSIKMEANFELPAIKKMRLEQMRQNVSTLQKEEILADTILERDYHFLKFGMMDWSLASYQKNGKVTNNRMVLGLGAELLYGQANVSIYYDDKYKFDNRQLYYNWRWVDNKKKIIRQAHAGKLYNQSISFLKTSVVGASISNTPTTVRKATGFYTLNEYTEPNWSVELYINDVLVDYTVADASGLYVFKVPNVYGYTTLKLKFYGPMGEERVEERTKNVPYTFMPANTLEYKLSGGVLQDEEGSQYGKGTVSYGLNNAITLGGGLEYLSSITDHPYIPFATLAFQPFSKMLLNFEYAHNVKITGLLNYNFGKSASLEINYADFVDGQLATPYNANEELKVRFSFPFKMNRISGYTKFNYNQFSYDEFNYNQIDAAVSGYFKNYSANLSTLFNWISDNDPYITSNLSLSYRMRNGIILRPSAEYNISDEQLSRYKFEVEKRVKKLYLSVYYERNRVRKSDNLFLSVRYDLPFARAGVSASHNNDNFYFTESASGSLAFGGDNSYVKPGNTSSIGKGGILFYPFLDLNQNGIKDDTEQMILLSNVRVSGGRADISEKDSIVRVSDLNAFIDYTVEFSDNDLDNIAWQFKHKTYQVLVDPHQYKRVYMPILSMGEVSGMVYLNKDSVLRGLGRVTVQIIDKHGNKVAETLSESDGYFSYLGLKPGDYTVRIDDEQLEILEYQSTPELHHSTIEQLIDGDIVNGLDFVLQTKKHTTTSENTEENISISDEIIDFTEKLQANVTASEKGTKTSVKIASKEKVRSNINTSFTEISTTEGQFYSVQIGIYRNYVTAKQLKNLTPIFYQVLPNGTNRYFSGQYKTTAEAELLRDQIVEGGIKEAYVVNHVDGKEAEVNNPQLVEQSTDSIVATISSEKSDSITTTTNVKASFTDISTIEELFYTVEVGTYQDNESVEELNNRAPLFYETLPGGNKRYFSGKYNTAEEAEMAKKQIISEGIENASVTTVGNDNKLAIQKSSLRQELWEKHNSLFILLLILTLIIGVAPLMKRKS